FLARLPVIADVVEFSTEVGEIIVVGNLLPGRRTNSRRAYGVLGYLASIKWFRQFENALRVGIPALRRMEIAAYPHEFTFLASSTRCSTCQRSRPKSSSSTHSPCSKRR